MSYPEYISFFQRCEIHELNKAEFDNWAYKKSYNESRPDHEIDEIYKFRQTLPNAAIYFK